MLHKIITVYKLLNSIMTDHDFVFINDFWANLMYILKIIKSISIIDHLQTDKQIERLNNMLKQYLHTFINYK